MTARPLFGNLSSADRVLLVLDLDGTLIARGNAPSPAARAALRELVAEGVTVTIATGRQLHSAESVLGALELDEAWLVASDGAIVAKYEGSILTTLAMTTFDPGPLAQALLQRDPGITFGAEDVGVGYHVNQRFEHISYRHHRQHVVDEFPSAVTMFTAVSTVVDGAELASAAAQLGLSYTGWDEDGMGWLDAAAPGLSKATGLASLVENVPAAGTVSIAAGDFHNDVALLEWADIGIAMGHGPPELKAVADHVTGAADQDGIVEVLVDLLAAVRQ